MMRRSPMKVLSGFQDAGKATVLNAILKSARAGVSRSTSHRRTPRLSRSVTRNVALLSDGMCLSPRITVSDAANLQDYGSRDLLRESGEVVSDPFPTWGTADAA